MASAFAVRDSDGIATMARTRVADDKIRSGKTRDGDVVVIKKYANRRLYNTSTSAYVTLDDLAKMVRRPWP